MSSINDIYFILLEKTFPLETGFGQHSFMVSEFCFVLFVCFLFSVMEFILKCVEQH